MVELAVGEANRTSRQQRGRRIVTALSKGRLPKDGFRPSLTRGQ